MHDSVELCTLTAELLMQSIKADTLLYINYYYVFALNKIYVFKDFWILSNKHRNCKLTAVLKHSHRITVVQGYALITVITRACHVSLER